MKAPAIFSTLKKIHQPRKINRSKMMNGSKSPISTVSKNKKRPTSYSVSILKILIITKKRKQRDRKTFE
jgi:electron transfer flavoprotein alpha/beta subunit